MSVHRTISTAVLRCFVAAHARAALVEPAGSEDVSSAFAATPDVTAAKSRGCNATCDFSGRATHPQSCPYRHRNDDGEYERRASGHEGVMKPRADAAGQGSLRQGRAGIGGKITNGITVMGYPKNKSCGIKEAEGRGWIEDNE